MKLYVLSDTHGKIEKAVYVWSKLHSVDLIVHLGDLARDAVRLSGHLGKPVVSVRGNNDFFYNTKEDFRVLETEYGNLLLTHGHLLGVKYGLDKLCYKALEMDCRAALFGHTHMPFFTEAGGLYLLNPGSLTHPWDGTKGSYAIVNTTPESFTASIVYYDDIK